MAEPGARRPVDLDDVPALLAADPAQMLRAVASGGGQVRRALLEVDRHALARVAAEGRPRGLVVGGMGGSGISGDVLLAVTGPATPVPTQLVRTHTLPGWVGALDVVVAVSCSGTTEETLVLAREAARRGARLVAIASAGSPLAALAAGCGGVVLPVDAQGLMPRASLWTLATPLLLLGAALGITTVAEIDLMRAADVLDEVAQANGVEVPVATNEAKTLAMLLAESWPVAWGESPLAAVAAYRLACQLNENAKLPCVWGALPEVAHNQIVAFDGRYGARANPADDLFRDPVEDGPPPPRTQLVVLRDPQAEAVDARRCDLALDLATTRGMRPFTIGSGPGPAVARLASLVASCDWASVYAALALGEDPTPIGPIGELKARLAASP